VQETINLGLQQSVVGSKEIQAELFGGRLSVVWEMQGSQEAAREKKVGSDLDWRSRAFNNCHYPALSLHIVLGFKHLYKAHLLRYETAQIVLLDPSLLA
jgi:hypothetical protein